MDVQGLNESLIETRDRLRDLILVAAHVLRVLDLHLDEGQPFDAERLVDAVKRLRAFSEQRI